MRNTKTIPTIIGVVTIIIGITSGVFLVKNKQFFRPKASPDLNPKDIRITNVGSESFSVSWITGKASVGLVSWGENTSSIIKTAHSVLSSESRVHHANIEKLKPETKYYFTINSGGYEFDNEGIPWMIETAPRIPDPPQSNVISGTVLNKNNNPASEILVYVTVAGSSPLSTLTSDKGAWVVPISNTRTRDLNSYININESSTLIEILAQAGPEDMSLAQVYVESAKPAPPITLGGTYDFRSAQPQKDVDVPEAIVDLPEEATPSSGFDVADISLIDNSTSAASPVPTGIFVQCQRVRAYDSGWNSLLENELENLKEGEEIIFSIYCTSSSGELTKAKFEINGELSSEVKDIRQETSEFYYKYLVKSTDIGSTMNVYGWVHNSTNNRWF